MMAARFVLLALLLPLLSEGIPIFLRHKWTEGGKNGMLLSISQDAPAGAPERWYDQQLDHFDTKNKAVWQQRYWLNDSNWDRKHGPVFLFIGGEGEEDNKWLQFGEMMDLAQKYRGLAIILEHRFYGKCHPTKNMSVANLKYLSSRQALADMAQFRSFIYHQYKMTSDNRWIAYGGSYSGALAAWARIKYPDSFYAAVATSAPVLAEYDFSQYLEVVQQSLLTTVKGSDCVAAIRTAMNDVDTYLADRKNWKVLEKLFGIDPPLNSTEDGKLLAENLAGVFMGVVQYNNDSRGNTTYDMNDLCHTMVNESIGKPLERLANLVNRTGANMDSNFTESLEFLTNATWEGNFGARQWFYQTCTEFGYFQTSDSKDQPFGNQITIDLYTSTCQKVFDVSSKQVQDNIKATNDYYGGKDIPSKTTRIVFPNGSIDPWHALGITKDISEELPAVFINGTAHCANMYPSSKYDRPELVEARAKISDILGKWLTS